MRMYDDVLLHPGRGLGASSIQIARVDAAPARSDVVAHDRRYRPRAAPAPSPASTVLATRYSAPSARRARRFPKLMSARGAGSAEPPRHLREPARASERAKASNITPQHVNLLLAPRARSPDASRAGDPTRAGRAHQDGVAGSAITRPALGREGSRDSDRASPRAASRALPAVAASTAARGPQRGARSRERVPGLPRLGSVPDCWPRSLARSFHASCGYGAGIGIYIDTGHRGSECTGVGTRDQFPDLQSAYDRRGETIWYTSQPVDDSDNRDTTSTIKQKASAQTKQNTGARGEDMHRVGMCPQIVLVPDERATEPAKRTKTYCV